MTYLTRQHQAVLDCLDAQAGEARTAVELAEALRQKGQRVGLATVYRQLDRLAEAGLVHKVPTEEGALYQRCPAPAAERPCFLLRCRRCGSITHLDCAQMEALYRHLEQEHHFRIDPRRTVLTGLCQHCGEQEDAHGGE